MKKAVLAPGFLMWFKTTIADVIYMPYFDQAKPGYRGANEQKGAPSNTSDSQAAFALKDEQSRLR